MITLEECADLLSDAPNGQRLLRAWNNWRGAALLPATDAVGPEDLGPVLSCMMVFEVFARKRTFEDCHETA